MTREELDRLSALAKVGIEALVDEATGFQKVRERDALRKRLEHHARSSEMHVPRLPCGCPLDSGCDSYHSILNEKPEPKPPKP